MDAAEVTFDFDLKLKKRSFIETILDKNSYTFNWIPFISVCSIIVVVDRNLTQLDSLLFQDFPRKVQM